jgi:hypothetical protein
MLEVKLVLPGAGALITADANPDRDIGIAAGRQTRNWFVVGG